MKPVFVSWCAALQKPKDSRGPESSHALDSQDAHNYELSGALHSEWICRATSKVRLASWMEAVR